MKNIAGLLLAAVYLGFSVPAGAATVSGTYYEDSVDTDCGGDNLCIVQIPLSSAISGKFLNVEHVACGGFAGAPFVRGMMYITDANGTNERRFRALSLPGVAGNNQFSWHESVQYKITGGPPRIFTLLLSLVQASVTFRTSCSISGTISTQ